MKSLRLSGLAGPAWQIIRDLRKVEVEASKRLRKIFLGTIMLSAFCSLHHAPVHMC
jgi:hypothetical protein